MGMNEEDTVSETVQRRLGRLPMKTTRKALLFADFFNFVTLPAKQDYWTKRTQLPLRTFGNIELGNCTRAKQAVAAQRMERLEQRRLIEITDEEIKRVYREMSDRRYGGGDNGAYEDDALSDWRNPELTFRDTAGHPYTIDAYLRVNAANHNELRAALVLSGAKGIAVCLNLPTAFSRIDPPATWDVPKDQPLIGEWMPGSWGGHSVWAHGYTKHGLWLDTTWNLAPNILTWEAAAAYLDEAHLCMDSVNAWRKKSTPKIRKALGDVVDAVNAVSSIPITA